MIVTCEQCRTQFQLDDAKVPASGIRVRCSRCKCAFFIESPQRNPHDTAAQPAPEAVANERPPAATTPEEESDWKFNDEVDPVRAPDDAPDDFTVARQAVDDLLGEDPVMGESDPVMGESDPVMGESDPADPFDSGFDFGAVDFTDDAAAETGAATIDDVAVEEDHDPNAVTIDRSLLDCPPANSDERAGLDLMADFDPTQDSAGVPEFTSDAMPEPDWSPESDWQPQSDWESESTAGPEGIAGPEVESSEAIEAPEPIATAGVTPVTSSPGPEAGRGESADLGNPENWDFFEGEIAEPDGEAFDTAPSAVRSDDTAATVGVFAGPREPDVDVSPGDAWFARVRGAVGWLLVVAMCAYSAGASFLPKSSVLAAADAPIRIAGFEAARVEGRWVENAVSGSVYVVSGAFHPSGSARAEPGSVLRVRLLGADGEAVAAESAAVGPPISIVRLRESNPRDLRAAQERGASNLLHDSLARRKRRPFTAVFGAVPPEAVAFDFQIAAATVAPAIHAVDPSAALDANAQAALAEEGRRVEARLPVADAPASTSPTTAAQETAPVPQREQARSRAMMPELEPEAVAGPIAAEESPKTRPPGAVPAAPATDGRP